MSFILCVQSEYNIILSECQKWISLVNGLSERVTVLLRYKYYHNGEILEYKVEI